MLVCIKSSVATKKGNKEGTTEVAHRLIPDLTAVKFALEKIKIEIVNSKNRSDTKFLFNFNTIKLFFKNMKFSFLSINSKLNFLQKWKILLTFYIKDNIISSLFLFN